MSSLVKPNSNFLKSKIIITAFILFIAAGLLVLESCRKKDHPFRGTPLAFTVPPGFPPPLFNFNQNPLTEEGFLLGRKLFFDGRLSADGNFPCASCHQPVAAFTTFEHDRSHGYNHSHTLRNAPGLFNLAWYPAFRQDGSATNMEAVSLAHILAPDEMATTMDAIIGRISGDTAYQRLFREAYGSADINQDRILRALTQFMVSLVSARSKYDRVINGEAQFTAEENAGYALFVSKCSNCHKEPLFTDFTYRNNGLPLDPGLNDYGRMRVTGLSSDSLKFRVPSLRNLDLTSYYGHDGRYSMFRMMLQHYRTGISIGPTLDPHLVSGIPMTNTDEDNLGAFLRTLSDSAFLNNPRFRE